jgi:sugar diacid utilization regulator/putative methionine-R-sulfoxide reductase with GAF domain
VELVSDDQVVRSALEAARTVLKAAYCAVAWRGGNVIATQGVSEARAAELAPGWLRAALGDGSRASLIHRVEPVLGPDGAVRGALFADLRGGVRPGDARALMPVFAAHLALLVEKVEGQARRTASYEALVQIGMQIQAAEADVDAALQLIVTRARELLGTDLAWMGLVNEADDTLEMRVAVGAATEPFMRMRLDLGDGVGGLVVSTRTPVALPDYARQRPPTPGWVSDAVLGEGIGSMLCCPMQSGEKVVGALYVGSRRPAEFPAIDVALTSALAAQGAVAIENGRLYAALAEQNRVLEGSFAVHRALTDAALSGAGRARICTELAGLLGAEVVLEQEVSPPFTARFPAGGDAPPTIGIPVEDFGRLSVCGLSELTPLQAKALEHAATVLALELVKERAQQQVEWQLQGDLLSELLDADGPLAPSLAARARRHGVDLARAHRIVAVRSPDAVADDLLALVRRVTGRSLLARDAALVCVRGEHVVLAARDGQEERAVRAIAAAAERGGARIAVGVSAAASGRRGDGGGHAPDEIAVAGHPGLVSAHREAVACAHLSLTRGDGVVRADQLGPLRFLLDAPDVAQVRAVVHEQLGPLAAHTGRADLLATLRAFVAADGNVAETARACFVHKNTLRYRLRRIAEVLGRDPADPDAKFHLRMAFDLVDLFASMGIEVLPPTEQVVQRQTVAAGQR